MTLKPRDYSRFSIQCFPVYALCAAIRSIARRAHALPPRAARIKPPPMPNAVRDNAERHRFELDADGHIAFSDYTRDGTTLTIKHTEVPKELNGKGIGSGLVRGLLDIARAQGLKVVPLCPFVAS